MKTDDEKRLCGFSECFLQSSHSAVKHFSIELMPQGWFSGVTGAEIYRHIRCLKKHDGSSMWDFSFRFQLIENFLCFSNWTFLFAIKKPILSMLQVLY